MEIDSSKTYFHDEEGVIDQGKILDHWLYRLACVFYSSSGFGDISNEYKFKSNLRKRFQEGEISTLLVSIAAFSRRNLDFSDERSLIQAKELSPENVGTLTKYMDGEEKTIDLSYREACNKIIHAQKVNFDYAEPNPSIGGTLNPTVFLYGSYNSHKWRAILNAELFMESAWNFGPG